MPAAPHPANDAAPLPVDLPARLAADAERRIQYAAALMRQTITRNVPDGPLRDTALDYVGAALAYAVEGVRHGG